MSKVLALMSMSLDGYVADRNDGVAEVFDWYFNSGDVEFHAGGADAMTFKVSRPSAEHLRGLWWELGAVLTGRRTFEVAHGWGGNHAWGPAFVLTHHVPAGWPRPDCPFRDRRHRKRRESSQSRRRREVGRGPRRRHHPAAAERRPARRDPRRRRRGPPRLR